MPRGKRTNASLRCQECENKQETYVTRVKRDKMKDTVLSKFCSTCRKHTPHKAKEIKGGY